MLGQPKLLALFPLSVLAPTIEGGAAEESSSSIDAGIAQDRTEFIVLEVGDVTNLDNGFVRILESVDGGVFSEICVLQMTPQTLQTRQIHRKGRYLKATLQYEFVQIDDLNPIASAIPLTLQVLR